MSNTMKKKANNFDVVSSVNFDKANAAFLTGARKEGRQLSAEAWCRSL